MSFQKLYDDRYQTGYRDRLEGYEVARWNALRHFIPRSLDQTEIRSVLDFGAGSGLYAGLWELLFPSAELNFCDISDIARQQFAKKFPHHAEQYNLISELVSDRNDDRFDLIVSVEVMEHVEDLDGYLREIFRLLKPGGYFIWTTPCANRLSIEHIFSLVTCQIQRTSEGYRRWAWEDPTHLRRLKSGEVAVRLQAVGFAAPFIKFRSHFFSFVCTAVPSRLGMGFRERLMSLDYALFRNFPNGASMLGAAKKPV